jgi:hypothetical protein
MFNGVFRRGGVRALQSASIASKPRSTASIVRSRFVESQEEVMWRGNWGMVGMPSSWM